MLKINNRAGDKLIKEYRENALDYLENNIKNNHIDFDLNYNNENIIKLIEDIDFQIIYDNYFRNNATIKKLFTYIKHHKNTTTTEESIYDNFRTKSLLKYFRKINKEIKTNTPNKKIDEINKKVAKLYKDFIKKLDINVCPYCGRNHIGYLKLKDNDGSDNNIKSLEAIEIEDNNTVTIVPSLDHFYPKSLYRQFSISLYNLIPSCNLCNLTLKHDIDEELLFPYKEGFEDYVKFNLGDNSEEDLMKVVMFLTGDSTVDTSDLDIRLVKDIEKIKKEKSNNNRIDTPISAACNEDLNSNKVFDNISDTSNINDYNSKIPLPAKADIPLYESGYLEDDGFIERCKNSNKIFHIEDIYNSEHKQNALDLISKIVWYRKNYIKSLNSILSLLEDNYVLKKHWLCNSQLLSFIAFFNQINSQLKNDGKNIDINNFLGDNFDFLFGRWLDPDNDLKEPLSKFHRDIYKQITEPHLYELLES